MPPDNQTIGWWGERLVAGHLQRHGFVLLDHQYRKSWGELDLVMSKDQKIRFIEVKSTAVANAESLPTKSVSAPFRPELHVNAHKISTLRRMAETWSQEFAVRSNLAIDVAVAYIAWEESAAALEFFWDIG